jgi:hypothetical protein
VPPLNELLYYWTIIDAVTLFRIFSKLGFSPGFSLFYHFFISPGGTAELRCVGGGVQRPVLCVNGPKNLGAQRGHNPPVKDIFVRKKTFSPLGNFNDFDVIV